MLEQSNVLNIQSPLKKKDMKIMSIKMSKGNEKSIQKKDSKDQ